MGGGPRTETPCTPPVSPVDLSWALSPLPEAPDLYWDFSSGDFHHMMGVNQNSSAGDNVSHAPAFSSSALINHRSLAQGLNANIEINNEVADVSYDLDSSQPSGQRLHQPESSLMPSSSIAAARIHNSSHSSLSVSTQDNRGFSRDRSHTQLHQSVGSRRGSRSRDSVTHPALMMDPPTPLRKQSWPKSGPPQMHGSLANAFVAPNVTSGSSVSGLPQFSRSSSIQSGEPPKSSDTGRMCHCVAVMLKILENMGAQGLGTDAKDPGAGFDVILSSLARGMNLTEQVLACGQCNACAENGMLLATITQQLSNTVASATTCLPLEEHRYESQESMHWCQNRTLSTPGPRSSDLSMIESSGSLIEPSNDDPTRMTSDLLEGKIFFGRYKVDSPEIRLQLMYYALLLHIGRLQGILVRIKDRVGSNRGAWKLLVHTGLEVKKLGEIFRSKVSHKQ